MVRNYLYIVNKKTNYINEEYVKSIIDHLKKCKHDYEYHRHNNIQCFTYTNEPSLPKSVKGDYFFSFSGQLAVSEDKIEENIRIMGPKAAKAYIKDIPGAYSISFAHFPSNSVRAYTHFSRVNPVYYFENTERIVVGMDPLIINCIGNNNDKPTFDLSKSVSFITHGYFCDDNTLFNRVKALPPNSEICIKDNQIEISYVDNSIDNMFTKIPTNEDYDELTELYLKAYDVVPRTENAHNVGLTGGKDSRLIVLGLLAKDIPFKTNTKGFDDHPDVVVAKQIADILNINHTVKSPELNKNNQLEINLIEKILKVMIGTSGTVYGYENINYRTKYTNRIGLTGIGAESIRGGYDNLRKIESKNVSEELIKRFFFLKEYILPEMQNEFSEFLFNFGHNEISFKEAQCKHYLFFRNGRWAGGTRSANSYSNEVYSPFLDNNFLKKATQLDINVLASEKLHFNIMERLNPKLVTLPFFNSRWLFEEKGPINPNNYRSWLSKKPVYAKTKLGSYNWRSLRNKDSTLRNAFKEILLNDPSSEIYNIVDYNQIQSILSKPVPAILNKLIWSLVSLQVYMDYFREQTYKHNIEIIRMNIPESKKLAVTKQPSLRDLNETIRPVNNSLIVNTDKTIVLNKKSDKFPYLQTGNQNFTKSPTANKDVLNIKGFKNLFVRFCIESEKIESNYKLFIMFYDNEKRIASQSFDYKAKGKRTYIEKNVPIIANATYVKFAIKLEPLSPDPKLTLKFGYMELK